MNTQDLGQAPCGEFKHFYFYQEISDDNYWKKLSSIIRFFMDHGALTPKLWDQLTVHLEEGIEAILWEARIDVMVSLRATEDSVDVSYRFFTRKFRMGVEKITDSPLLALMEHHPCPKTTDLCWKIVNEDADVFQWKDFNTDIRDFVREELAENPNLTVNELHKKYSELEEFYD
ncbi:hypothetical protein [Oleidesulfovibrio alaskensis]